ncbi:hypothetical protein V6L77_23335 [Pannonibacter sp. Pt2-lr]
MVLTRASTKQLLARLHDVIMAALAMTIALLARYDLQILPPMSRLAWWVVSFAAIAGVMFALFGLGRGIWRFASLSDLRSIVLSSTAAIFAFLILHFLVDRLAGFPRATPLILWFVVIVLLGAPRIMYRAYKDGHLGGVGFRKRDMQNREHVLIVGHVGDADNVIRNYKLESSRLYKVEGIVELGAGKRSGRAVRGFRLSVQLMNWSGSLAVLQWAVSRFRRCFLQRPVPVRRGCSLLPPVPRGSSCPCAAL